jgi:hypothetical protein
MPRVVKTAAEGDVGDEAHEPLRRQVDPERDGADRDQGDDRHEAADDRAENLSGEEGPRRHRRSPQPLELTGLPLGG